MLTHYPIIFTLTGNLEAPDSKASIAICLSAPEISKIVVPGLTLQAQNSTAPFF